MFSKKRAKTLTQPSTSSPMDENESSFSMGKSKLNSPQGSAANGKSPIYDDYYDTPSFLIGKQSESTQELLEDGDASLVSNFSLNMNKGHHVRRPSIIKKAGSMAQKNRAVSFRNSHTTTAGEGNSRGGGGGEDDFQTTDKMKMIDESHVVILDDDTVNDQTESNSHQTEYYMNREGNMKLARDRYSIDELAMQPKIV